MCQRFSLEWEIFIGEVLSISDYTHFSVFTPISLRFAIIIKLIAWNFKPKPAQDIRHVWTPNFVYLKLLWPQFFYSWNCFYTEYFLQKNLFKFFYPNFIPVFFWTIFTKLFVPKFFGQNFIDLKFFWHQKNFNPQFFYTTFFGPKMFWPNIFSSPSTFLAHFFYFHTSFGQISFGPKNFVPKNVHK